MRTAMPRGASGAGVFRRPHYYRLAVSPFARRAHLFCVHPHGFRGKVFLLSFSINLLALYHECRPLIDYATHVLFRDRGEFEFRPVDVRGSETSVPKLSIRALIRPALYCLSADEDYLVK